MDIIGNIDEYIAIIDEAIMLSKEYAAARAMAAKAKQALDMLLAAHLAQIRKEKPNIGYELAIITLCEKEKEAGKYLEDLIAAESHYKGIEKILEALQSKISFVQSLMKYIKENGG